MDNGARIVVVRGLPTAGLGHPRHDFPGWSFAPHDVVPGDVVHHKPENGVSAPGLQRTLGLGSYKTAWALLHKLRRAMVRPDRDRLGGRIEVDETYWGSVEKGLIGRPIEEKTLIIVAAEQDGRGIGRFPLARIPDLTKVSVHGFIAEAVEPSSTVCTDGLNVYHGLAGYVHDRQIQRSQPEGQS
jgi:hypothetical protein